MSELLITLGILVFFLFAVAACRAAYRNGVRDGYENPWLPKVQDQIKRENLRQYKDLN